MTRSDAEIVARNVRAKCLRLSWPELVDFWEQIIADLEVAYKSTVKESVAHGSTSVATSGNPRLKESLTAVLARLVGREQLNLWGD
jgi:hypothetical protein